jgi:hypothetical protein
VTHDWCRRSRTVTAADQDILLGFLGGALRVGLDGTVVEAHAQEIALLLAVLGLEPVLVKVDTFIAASTRSSDVEGVDALCAIVRPRHLGNCIVAARSIGHTGTVVTVDVALQGLDAGVDTARRRSSGVGAALDQGTS